MSVSHLYENFSGLSAPAGKNTEQTEDELEDVKLSSFETGYQAGWEDAVKAQGTTEARLTEEFVQNMQDLSFTYHEAYTKLSIGMKPLISAILTKLLPQIAEQSLAPQIMDQVNTLIKDQSGSILEIAVAPENHAAVEKLLQDQAADPFVLTAEPALSGGQVYLRVGKTEREINLDAVLEGVSTAIEAFFHTAEQQESEHG